MMISAINVIIIMHYAYLITAYSRSPPGPMIYIPVQAQYGNVQFITYVWSNLI